MGVEPEVRPSATPLAHGAADAHPSTALTAVVLVTVVLMFGISPPLNKLITAPPLVITALRFGLLAPIVIAVLYSTGGRLTPYILRRTIVPGVLNSLANIILINAFKHASVAVVSVVFALQPGLILIVASRWLRERPTVWHVAWTVVAVSGVAIAVMTGNKSIKLDALGVLLAVANLLTLTSYYVLNRHVRITSTINPMEWTAGSSLCAALAITPIAVATHPTTFFDQVSTRDWVYVGLLVAATFLSNTLISWAHRYVPAGRSSLFLLGWVVVAIIVSWPLFGEQVTVLQGLGCAIVLGAVGAVVSRPGSVKVVERTS